MKFLLCFALVFFNSITTLAALHPGATADDYLPSRDIEIQLNQQIYVDTEFVVFGDVAKIYALNEEDAQKISGLNLLKFPAGIREITIPAQYVRSRLIETLGPDKSIEFRIPDEIKFTRKQIRLSQEELRALIIEKAQKQKKIPSEVAINIRSLYTQKLPIQPIGAKAVITNTKESSRWHGLTNFQLYFIKNGQKVGKTIWLRADIRWQAKRWQSQKEIGYHERLKAEDFKLVDVEIQPFQVSARKVLTSKELSSLLQNARAKQPIKVKSLLSRSMIEKKPDKKIGESIDVVFLNSYGLTIRSKGSVMENSSIGTEVKVKLKGSKKIVSGTMIDKNTMEVKL